MNFGSAVRSGYKNYFRLRGRAKRSEYWYFFLFTMLLSVATQTLLVAAHHADPGTRLTLDLLSLIISIASLSAVCPSVTLLVRRLHDAAHSGWWILAQFSTLIFGSLLAATGLISHMKPVIFAGIALGVANVVICLVIFIFLVQPSNDAYNRYDIERY
jgi:uncharacterized membrane protein YhaH (DUF805 family)